MNLLHNRDEDGYRYEDEHHHPHQEEDHDNDDDESVETLNLRPSVIRYSHDSIGCKFSNGLPLTSVFAHLISGSLEVADLPRVHVLNINGHFWAVTGNRRLYLYRMLEEVGVVETISVTKSSVSPTSKAFKKQFTNGCGGMEISCRQNSLRPSLVEIVSDWQSGQDVVAKWDPLKQVPAFHGDYQEDNNHDDQNHPEAYGHDESGYYCGEQYDYDQEEEEDDDYYNNQNEYGYPYGYYYRGQDEHEDDDYYNNVYEYHDDTDEEYDLYDTEYNCHIDTSTHSAGKYEDDSDDYFSQTRDEDENQEEDAGFCNVM